MDESKNLVDPGLHGHHAASHTPEVVAVNDDQHAVGRVNVLDEGD
jgi:hypothetical protein